MFHPTLENARTLGLKPNNTPVLESAACCNFNSESAIASIVIPTASVLAAAAPATKPFAISVHTSRRTASEALAINFSIKPLAPRLISRRVIFVPTP